MAMGMRSFIKRRRKRNESGSAAVEFALIAPIFFTLLFASMETGLSYFGNMILETGVQDVGRLIRTGQAQNANMSQSQFRDQLCDRVRLLLSCDPGKLIIDVRSFASFGGAGYLDATEEDGSLSGDLGAYDLGSSSLGTGNSIVLVRAFYTWPLFVPLFSQYYANMPGEMRLLSSSVAFRNEPF